MPRNMKFGPKPLAFAIVLLTLMTVAATVILFNEHMMLPDDRGAVLKARTLSTSYNSTFNITVTDEDGRPIGGLHVGPATVKIIGNTTNPAGWQTDLKGSKVITGIFGNTIGVLYNLSVNATGFQTSLDQVVAKENRTTNVTIILIGGVILGKVSTAAVPPVVIPGATVMIKELGPGYSNKTNSLGQYIIRGIPQEQNYTVLASASGYIGATTPNVHVPINGSVDFVLAYQTGNISGVVYNFATHRGLNGANVSVEIQKNFVMLATSSANGSYELDGVPVGTYNVTASMVGFNSSTTPGVKIAWNHQTTLSFNLTEIPTLLHGTVRSGTLLLVRANISVVGTSFYNLTGPDGTYEMTKITPGIYTVQASKSGYVAVQFSGVKITQQNHTTLNFNLTEEPTLLRGTVRSGTLLLVRANISIVGTTLYYLSGPDGIYNITNLTAGTYTVQASRLGYVTGLFPNVVIGPGEAKVLNINLTAVPGAILRGIVSALVGNIKTPLVDVKVTLVTTNPTENATSTNSMGEFAFTGLTPGNYTVLFELAGYRPLQQSGITVKNDSTPTHQFFMTPLRHGFSGFIFGFDMPHSMMILGLFLTIVILAVAVYLRIRTFQAPGSAPAVYDDVDDETGDDGSADGQNELEDRLSESRGKKKDSE
jgi:hypothetical protein